MLTSVSSNVMHYITNVPIKILWQHGISLKQTNSHDAKVVMLTSTEIYTKKAKNEKNQCM
jgi:hypothetical protein